jgi:tetratricopeptide (TPR) repeat protein
VGLDFTHDFTGQDEWAGRGARRMLEQRLRGERRLTLAALDDANVVLGASLTRPAAGEVRLRLTARRARLGAAAFEAVVSGASVAEAYDRALPALVAAIAQGRPAPPWTPAELEEARRLGARTPEGLQLYRRVTTCMLTTTVYAVSECQALAKTLLDLEPTWPRAWLAEVELAPEPASECALALERTAASTDALGRASLRTRCRDPVRVPGAQLDGSDPLLVYFPPFLEARMDVVVMYMSAFDRRPELAFGDTMRDHVRGEQAENLMRQWAQKAPEALQRLVSLGDLGAVELGEVLHGRHPALQVAKARAWLAALDFSRAQAEAREVVAAEDPLVRLAGLLLFAEAGLYQGELGSALKQLEIAARLSDALNPSVGFAQLTYGALRGTAQLVGDEPTRRSAIERYLKRLRFPAILGAVPLGYELAGEHCPPLPLQHPDKYGANRELMAAAQGRGCASCEEVLAHPVTEEPSVDLVSDQSVLTYLQCARRSGQYALALRAYEQTFQGRMGTLTDRRRSPAHAVLARYELARTLEAMGREAEALAAWKTAARFWQNLDTLRPEPEEARAAIARLSPLGAPGQ